MLAQSLALYLLFEPHLFDLASQLRVVVPHLLRQESELAGEVAGAVLLRESVSAGRLGVGRLTRHQVDLHLI